MLTDNIGDIRIITPTGNYVLLREGDRENRLGFSVVKRQDGFREVAIQGDLNGAVIATPEALQIVKEAGQMKLRKPTGSAIGMMGGIRNNQKPLPIWRLGQCLR